MLFLFNQSTRSTRPDSRKKNALTLSRQAYSSACSEESAFRLPRTFLVAASPRPALDALSLRLRLGADGLAQAALRARVCTAVQSTRGEGRRKSIRGGRRVAAAVRVYSGRLQRGICNRRGPVDTRLPRQGRPAAADLGDDLGGSPGSEFKPPLRHSRTAAGGESARRKTGTR